MNDVKSLEQTLLAAVTATTTSAWMNVEGFHRVGLQLTAASISSGNGVFTVEGTIDGSTVIALNVIVDNLTNTNGQTLTRVASKTLSSNSSILVWLLDVTVKAVRVKVTRTTDGAYSAYGIAN